MKIFSEVELIYKRSSWIIIFFIGSLYSSLLLLLLVNNIQGVFFTISIFHFQKLIQKVGLITPWKLESIKTSRHWFWTWVVAMYLTFLWNADFSWCSSLMVSFINKEITGTYNFASVIESYEYSLSLVITKQPENFLKSISSALQ